ncbi:MAG: hypothetical protein IAI50_05065 [Candidatus Eremiobacteraeota bacterium]|nr:hypothetical protein [Candidatus Eremiobacteraeota bacterium]
MRIVRQLRRANDRRLFMTRKRREQRRRDMLAFNGDRTIAMTGNDRAFTARF